MTQISTNYWIIKTTEEGWSQEEDKQLNGHFVGFADGVALVAFEQDAVEVEDMFEANNAMLSYERVNDVAIDMDLQQATADGVAFLW